MLDNYNSTTLYFL